MRRTALQRASPEANGNGASEGRSPEGRREAMAGRALAGVTVIVGLGETGLSCARHLHRQGMAFAVTDTRRRPPRLRELRAELPATPLSLGALDERLLLSAGRILLSPGVSASLPIVEQARRAGIPVLGDVALFRQRARAPILAVTGTNGKSTVVSLLAATIRQAGLRAGLGGNVGYPAPPALDLLQQECDRYVLEVSSFQLETVESLDAHAAAVLNVAPDHLDRHGDMDAYTALKARIYHGAGVGIVNRDDARVSAMPLPGNVIGFTLGAPGRDDFGIVEDRRGAWLAHGGERLLPIAELPLLGRHNVANCLAALALATAAGVPRAAAVEAIRGFAGLPHRLRCIARHGGIAWYDDSKATNAHAACASLLALTDGALGRVVLLLGGQPKEGDDYTPLAEAARGRVQLAIAIGAAAAGLQRALADVVPVGQVSGMDEAVRLAARNATPGDRILLAPACASFDRYADYRERGRDFARAVEVWNREVQG